MRERMKEVLGLHERSWFGRNEEAAALPLLEEGEDFEERRRQLADVLEQVGEPLPMDYYYGGDEEAMRRICLEATKQGEWRRIPLQRYGREVIDYVYAVDGREEMVIHGSASCDFIVEYYGLPHSLNRRITEFLLYTPREVVLYVLRSSTPEERRVASYIFAAYNTDSCSWPY